MNKIKSEYIHFIGRTESENQYMKKKLFIEVIEGVKYLKLHDKKKHINITVDVIKEQNCFFNHFSRYDALNDSLYQELRNKYNGDLTQMIKSLR